MTDKQIQRKLDQLARLANELDIEARSRWPHPEASLFFEAEGHFYMMSGDVNESAGARQKFVEFSSPLCTMGSGAW